jgi:cobalt-zinc-cadmium efflux system protein
VDGIIVVVIAIIGVAINAVTALLFASGRERDLNIKGAYLHMAADAGVSLGVAVTGVAVMLTGWFWLDPVVSIAIVVVIAFGTWGLLRDSVNLSLDGVPTSVDFPAVETYLRNHEHVTDIHDLHVWALSTTENALTVHLVIRGDSLDNNVIREIQEYLHDHHGIEHATIQLESANGSVCALSCEVYDKPKS